MGPGQLQRAAGPALVRLLGPARGRLGRQERGRLAGLCAVDDEVLGPHRRRLRGQAPHPAAASRLPVQRPGRGRGRGRRGRAARQLGESLFPPFFLRVQRTKTGRRRENEKLTQLSSHFCLLLPQNSFTRLTSTTARWSFTTAGWTSARGRLRSASGGTGTVSEGFRSVLSTFSF